MLLFSHLKVLGHSMEPVILNSQSIIVSNIPYFFGKPKIGDIIAFKDKNKMIIKRIKLIKNDKFKVVGDNKKDSLDFGWIQRSEILGKVIYK